MPGLVVKDAGQRDLVRVQGGGVGGQDLEAGTRLPCGASVGPVQALACLLGAPSAYHGLDLAGGLVDDGDRSLGLRRDGDALVIGVALLGNRGLPLLHHSSGSVLGGKDEGVFNAIGVFPVRLHALRAVVLYGAVRPGDGQRVGETVLLQPWEVGVIVHLLIADLLHGSVLCGDDSQAAAVEGVVCLAFRVPEAGHEIVDDLLGEGVYKIGIR